MSAERMAEIEARLREFGGRHPHYNDYVRAERAFVTYAPIDLRWLLDRVRELEGAMERIAISPRYDCETGGCGDPECCGSYATMNAYSEGEWVRYADVLAAHSPSGEGQP